MSIQPPGPGSPGRTPAPSMQALRLPLLSSCRTFTLQGLSGLTLSLSVNFTLRKGEPSPLCGHSTHAGWTRGSPLPSVHASSQDKMTVRP